MKGEFATLALVVMLVAAVAWFAYLIATASL